MKSDDSSGRPGNARSKAVPRFRTTAIIVVLVILAATAAPFFNQENEEINMTVSGSSEAIEFIEVQTGIDPRFAVIWLHGLGADGHDFEAIVPELNLPDDVPIRFIFPHAPVRPITVNNGMHMRGWYDVYDVPINPEGSNRQDRAGLEHSMQIVRELIEQEVGRGIPEERIILAGFSQGGAIVLFSGLRHPRPLAGILALSTYLPDAETTAGERHDANRGIPIFMGHGTDDPIIPMEFSRQSYGLLVEMEYEVQWKSYPMPHSVHPEEIGDISVFLRGILEPD